MASIAQTVQATEMDVRQVFGFVIGFLTVVCLIYRGEFRTRLPLMVMLLSGLALYAFLAGVWPLGIVMIALATAEIRRWRAISSVDPHLRSTGNLRFTRRLSAGESRLSRMFEN